MTQHSTENAHTAHTAGPGAGRPTRTALVTGGNRGLGRSEAEHLAAAGLDVVVTYRTHRDEAAEVVAAIEATGRRAVALRLDTGRPETFGAFAEDLRSALRSAFGHEQLHVLVNNAGHAGWTKVGATRLEDVRGLVDVHLTGVVMLTEVLLPLLADGGRVVNTSSGLARFCVDDGYSVYGAVKGAVEVYTRYLAQALGPRRITANVIAPGATATDFGGGAVRDDETVRRHLDSTVAMGRVGEAEDIGAAVAALVDDRMSWVTAQRIEASGGQNL